MPAQRTFTLIPQHPGGNDPPGAQQPGRAMTSKQAQKAYKAANRGPKLSRADRIKEERVAQELIRKEFEKEKAAAKAKAVREKKKEKEQAEKEAKRKKGLPLVNVRPSQDTIAWFVRGNGSAKKRDSEGKQVEANKAPETEPEPEPEPQPEPQPEPETPCPPPPAPKLDSITEEKEETEDNLGDLDDLDDSFEEEIALELLQDVEASIMRASMQNPDKDGRQAIAHPPTAAPATTVPRKPEPTAGYKHDLGIEKPAQPIPSPPRPPPIKQVYNSPSPSPSPPHQAPPMSTQAILFNFDDFFPTPSQQARELEEDLAEDDFDFPIESRREPEKQPPKVPEPPEPSLPEPVWGSPPPPPRRFFTSSGSHELMSIAIQRSRRTAASEETQRRERARIEAAEVEAEAKARTRREEAKATAAAVRPPPKPVARPTVPGRMASGHNPAMQRKPENTKMNTNVIPGKPVPRPGPPPPSLKHTSKPCTPRPNPAGARRDNATPRIQGKTTVPVPPRAPACSSPRSNLMQRQGNNKENAAPQRTVVAPAASEAQAPPRASQETDYGEGDWLDDIASELMM